jgi:hypothetical protein
VSRRGQLVLLTAAVVAAALAPALFAYLQLGYHADVEASRDFETPTADAVAALDRAVFEASASIAGEYAWSERGAAADRVRAVLAPRIDRLEASRVVDGTAISVSYNGSAAAEATVRDCPAGDGRAFGDCRADAGVVLQERAGESALVAVAFDVRVVRPNGRTTVTVVDEVG